MLPTLAVLQYLTLAFWIGAMAGFSFLFSPLLFKLLPSRSLAGEVAGASLARLDMVGFISSGIMLVITLLQAIGSGGGRMSVLRVLLVVIMLALMVLNVTSVRARMATIRAQLPAEIDQADPADPNRKAYRKLHGISMAIFTLVMLLGAVLIALSALAPPPPQPLNVVQGGVAA